MDETSLAARPRLGDSDDSSPVGEDRPCTRKQQTVGDPLLSPEGRAAILALTAEDAYGTYLGGYLWVATWTQTMCSTPYGIRTRVTGVKGQRPRPLDERGTTS